MTNQESENIDDENKIDLAKIIDTPAFEAEKSKTLDIYKNYLGMNPDANQNLDGDDKNKKSKR